MVCLLERQWIVVSLWSVFTRNLNLGAWEILQQGKLTEKQPNHPIQQIPLMFKAHYLGRGKHPVCLAFLKHGQLKFEWDGPWNLSGNQEPR